MTTPDDGGEPRQEQDPSSCIDFTYRYRPERPKPFFVPRDWREAELYLRVGNELIVRFHDACKHDGYAPGDWPSVVEISGPEAKAEPKGDDGLPKQMPFALMLGCSDARVPTELLFGQEFNDIFNIRVAGNVLAEEGVGSLLYALRSFAPDREGPNQRSLRLAAVVGHRGCGAVRATVQAFLDPIKDAAAFGEPIGAILRRITSPALVMAVEAINIVFGEGFSTDPALVNAVIEVTVYLNAAWGAHQVQEWVDREGPDTSSRVGVLYAVMDPNDWRVRSLPPVEGKPEPEMFGRPPANQDELRSLAIAVAMRLKSAVKPPTG